MADYDLPPPKMFEYKEPTETKSEKKGAWEIYRDDLDDNELNTLRRQARDYAGATSIHGFAYLGEEGRSFIEKCVNFLKNFLLMLNAYILECD